MLIKCAGCGHENQLGAIFCRGCGEKLDVETMRPKVEDKRGSSFSVFGLIRNLVGFAIFIGVVAIIVMMFYPQDLSVYTALSGADAIKAADAKYTNMLKKAEEGFGDETFTFTAQEATYLYNEKFVEKPVAGEAAAYAIEKLIFHVDGMGFTHIILKTKMMGSIPTTFEISGTIVSSEPKQKGKVSVTFKPTEFKMGHMPIMFAEAQILEKFIPATTGVKIQKLLEGISKIEVPAAEKNFVVKF